MYPKLSTLVHSSITRQLNLLIIKSRVERLHPKILLRFFYIVGSMKIKFIGTGGAFDVKSGNSSALLSAHSMTLLIDCGHSVFPQLVTQDLVHQLDAALITHFHDDHVGSLSSLLFYRMLVLQLERLPIYVPDDHFKSELIRFLQFAVPKPETFADFRLLEELPWVGAIDTFGQHVAGMQTYGYCFRENDEAIAYSGDLGQPALFFKIFYVFVL